MTTTARPGGTARKVQAIVLGLLGFATFAWHLHAIAATTGTDHPVFPILPSLLTLTCTMAALYLWSRTRD